MPAREEESEMKQDWEDGQIEKDSGGNTAVDLRVGGKEGKSGWREEKGKIKVAGKQRYEGVGEKRAEEADTAVTVCAERV